MERQQVNLRPEHRVDGELPGPVTDEVREPLETQQLVAPDLRTRLLPQFAAQRVVQRLPGHPPAARKAPRPRPVLGHGHDVPVARERDRLSPADPVVRRRVLRRQPAHERVAGRPRRGA